MSRELQQSLSYKLDQGNRPVHKVTRQQFITTEGNNHMTGKVYSIGTTATTLSLPAGMGTPQAIYVENLDPTNFVIIGATSDFSTVHTPIKLYPKNSDSKINFGLIPWQGSQVTASAKTAAIDLYMEIFEA